MKKDIHPEYTELTVKFPNGKSFVTKSTYKGDVLQLDVDPSTHPAWNKSGSAFINKKAGKVAKFNEKFGNLGFGGGADNANKES